MKEFEIWKDIPGYPGYQVSTHGRVKGKFGRILRPDTNYKGYYRVLLMVDGKRYSRPIHRLVGLTFLGLDPNDKWQVMMHLDDNPKNNYLSNLKVGTHKENTAWNIKGEWGLYQMKNGHWKVTVCHKGKRRYTSRKTKEDAIAVRDSIYKEMIEELG